MRIKFIITYNSLIEQCSVVTPPIDTTAIISTGVTFVRTETVTTTSINSFVSSEFFVHVILRCTCGDGH